MKKFNSTTVFHSNMHLLEHDKNICFLKCIPATTKNWKMNLSCNWENFVTNESKDIKNKVNKS